VAGKIRDNFFDFDFDFDFLVFLHRPVLGLAITCSLIYFLFFLVVFSFLRFKLHKWQGEEIKDGRQ